MAALRVATPADNVGLVKYDEMCRAIADCYSTDEVKEIRNKARALEVYAKQARNREAERKAAEIRLRAERRSGELLRELSDNGTRHSQGGDQKSKSARTTLKAATLPTLGITKDQSSQWQKLAAIPKDQFEEVLTRPGPIPTTEGIINAHLLVPPVPQVDEDAIWTWGRIRDFDRRGILALPAKKILGTMTDPMREDLRNLLPDVIAFLKELKDANG